MIDELRLFWVYVKAVSRQWWWLTIDGVLVLADITERTFTTWLQPAMWIKVTVGLAVLMIAQYRAYRELRKQLNVAAQDAQIETHKAVLERSGRIHERLVDALLAIHAKLESALFYLQRASSAFKFAGEASERELLDRMARDLGEASEELSKNRLLIAERLQPKFDEFFKKTTSARVTFHIALEPMIQVEQRAKLWGEVRDIAYKELPSILEGIRTEAGAVIHG
jgi:hypothetical protein